MKYVVIYTRKGQPKRMEAELNNDAELGRFVYNNQPMQVIAVRVETNSLTLI